MSLDFSRCDRSSKGVGSLCHSGLAPSLPRPMRDRRRPVGWCVLRGTHGLLPSPGRRQRRQVRHGSAALWSCHWCSACEGGRRGAGAPLHAAALPPSPSAASSRRPCPVSFSAAGAHCGIEWPSLSRPPAAGGVRARRAMAPRAGAATRWSPMMPRRPLPPAVGQDRYPGAAVLHDGVDALHAAAICGWVARKVGEESYA